MTIPAAVLAAILFVGMAAFQLSLALGAPLGAHVLGGRHAGALPYRLRVVSAIAAAILVAGALVILARADAIGWPTGATGLMTPASWGIAVFLVLNTLGNVASKSRIERTVFATTTAVLAVLSAYVALS
jgi:electron transfer flavoprotein alpha/beta subunit